MPSTKLRRKIDVCEAVTKDIVRIFLERIAAIGGDFDEKRERCRLHQLLTHNYAHSIYGTAFQSRASHHSESSSIAAKRAEAAAELAAKEAHYRVMQEELKQRKKIRLMEEQHKRKLETQWAHLECLQAERDMDAACARLEIHDWEIKQESVHQPIKENNRQPTFSAHVGPQCPRTDRPVPPTDVSSLAQAIH